MRATSYDDTARQCPGPKRRVFGLPRGVGRGGEGTSSVHALLSLGGVEGALADCARVSSRDGRRVEVT